MSSTYWVSLNLKKNGHGQKIKLSKKVLNYYSYTFQLTFFFLMSLLFSVGAADRFEAVGLVESSR